MRSEELEPLLFEDEGATLDFKRDQYAFVKATDEEKSELLKDILGFANCYRRSEAFILIGVQEVPGARSSVYGLTEHLQDHALQQFVNNLTNRPIRFGYETCELEGKQVGVIRIGLQHRPIYLKRDYGKLLKDLVYVRRGSSTDPSKPAGPDEIALMGREQSIAGPIPSIAVEFAASSKEQSRGTRINWSAELCKVPEGTDIPRQSIPEGFWGQGAWDVDYYRKLAVFERARRRFRIIRLLVFTNGPTEARDVRIEIVIPNSDCIQVTDISEYPSNPKRFQPFTPHNLTRKRPVLVSSANSDKLVIVQHAHCTKLEFECGDMQPGRKVWTDSFYLAISRNGHNELTGHILAANLPEPKKFSLLIDADIIESEISVEELRSLPEPPEDDEFAAE